MWTLDVNTYEWIYRNTTHPKSVSPSPRQQHTTSVVNNILYMFGGKTDIYLSINKSDNKMLHQGAHVYGDLWLMKIPHPTLFTTSYNILKSNLSVPFNYTVGVTAVPTVGQGLLIPQDKLMYVTINSNNSKINRQLYGDGRHARAGKCIEKLVLKVTILHPCINQLKIYLSGPGDMSGDANYHPSSYGHQVIVFDTPATNGIGCSGGLHEFTFDEDSDRLSYTCCTRTFKGVYKPQGPLSEYIGYSPNSNWTLIIDDTISDRNIGYIMKYDIDFTVSDCTKKFVWSNVTTSPLSTITPSPRYQAKTIVYDSYIFLFGGRNLYDVPLLDLYRFDTNTSIWVQLNPISFGDVLSPTSATGMNFVLTPRGLIRHGGYYRLPTQSSTKNENYDNLIELQDVETLRWIKLEVTPWPIYDGSSSKSVPPGRYLSSMAFISTNQVSWRKKFSYRSYFDQILNSTHTNYIGVMTDSLLLFGGYNGVSGSIFDGSSGGILSDMWMVRLVDWNHEKGLATTILRTFNSCQWRQEKQFLKTCLGNSNADCSLRDMLILAWCAGNNQTLV